MAALSPLNLEFSLQPDPPKVRTFPTKHTFSRTFGCPGLLLTIPPTPESLGDSFQNHTSTSPLKLGHNDVSLSEGITLIAWRKGLVLPTFLSVTHRKLIKLPMT